MEPKVIQDLKPAIPDWLWNDKFDSCAPQEARRFVDNLLARIEPSLLAAWGPETPSPMRHSQYWMTGWREVNDTILLWGARAAAARQGAGVTDDKWWFRGQRYMFCVELTPYVLDWNVLVRPIALADRKTSSAALYPYILMVLDQINVGGEGRHFWTEDPRQKVFSLRPFELVQFAEVLFEWLADEPHLSSAEQCLDDTRRSKEWTEAYEGLLPNAVVDQPVHG
jgi:hypothetical protein